MEFLSPVALEKPTVCDFLEDTYLFSRSGVRVVDVKALGSGAVELKFGSHVVVMESTCFHPQGGGQPADQGTITVGDITFEVGMVKLVNGVVLHYCSTKADFGEEALQSLIGGTAEQQVDETHRREVAALHSAGHLIDVAMDRLGLLGDELVATKGYHFKDGPFVEFQGSMDQVLAELPAKLNEVLRELVEADIPTTVELLSRDDAGTKCGCDTSTYPPQVRVVSVGDRPCPCGGTHIKSTKDLGCVNVTKVKKKKNVYKVSYSVGAE